ncbi:MAG: HEAT repeat domain-containing protein [candidate division Zixibacteria bacterium]|nr:HEAT repeat domain-containing protein [candidate division Zixibacteria bacterium]
MRFRSVIPLSPLSRLFPLIVMFAFASSLYAAVSAAVSETVSVQTDEASADTVNISGLVDSLFVIASSGELRYREQVEPAKEELVKLGARAAPRLVEKLTTPDARERLTIIRTLAKIGGPAVPHLRRSLVRLENALQLKRICWALGDMNEAAAPALPELIVSASNPDWQVREYSLRALGKIGDTSTAQYVIDALSDPVGQVRKSAAWSAGQLKTAEFSAVLAHTLDDEYYGARLNAADALALIGPTAATSLMALIGADDGAAGDLACETLGRACAGENDPVVTSCLIDQLLEGRPSRRAAAARGLGYCAGQSTSASLQSLRLTESDPYVIQMIDDAVRRMSSSE